MDNSQNQLSRVKPTVLHIEKDSIKRGKKQASGWVETQRSDLLTSLRPSRESADSKVGPFYLREGVATPPSLSKFLKDIALY